MEFLKTIIFSYPFINRQINSQKICKIGENLSVDTKNRDIIYLKKSGKLLEHIVQVQRFSNEGQKSIKVTIVSAVQNPVEKAQTANYVTLLRNNFDQNYVSQLYDEFDKFCEHVSNVIGGKKIEEPLSIVTYVDLDSSVTDFIENASSHVEPKRVYPQYLSRQLSKYNNIDYKYLNPCFDTGNDILNYYMLLFLLDKENIRYMHNSCEITQDLLPSKEVVEKNLNWFQNTISQMHAASLQR